MEKSIKELKKEKKQLESKLYKEYLSKEKKTNEVVMYPSILESYRNEQKNRIYESDTKKDYEEALKKFEATEEEYNEEYSAAKKLSEKFEQEKKDLEEQIEEIKQEIRKRKKGSLLNLKRNLLEKKNSNSDENDLTASQKK